MEVAVSARKVRRILEIANEAHEITDPAARFKHTLTGALQLVGADVGCLFVFDSTRSQIPVVGVLEGYNPQRSSAVLAEYARGDEFDIMAQRLRANFAPAGRVLARRRQALISDRHWYNSTYVNDYRRRWGFDHSIYCMLGYGTTQLGMSVNRSFGARQFEPEDQSLVEIFHLAFSRVVAEASRSDVALTKETRRRALAPRARDTLECLLRGASSKDIAEELGLSPNTVRHYTKAIFRAFGVHSRGELLAHWHAER